MVRTDNARQAERRGQRARQRRRKTGISATGEPVPRPDDQYCRNDHDRDHPQVLLKVVRDHVKPVDQHDRDGDRRWDQSEQEPHDDVIGPSARPRLCDEVRG